MSLKKDLLPTARSCPISCTSHIAGFAGQSAISDSTANSRGDRFPKASWGHSPLSLITRIPLFPSRPQGQDPVIVQAFLPESSVE